MQENSELSDRATKLNSYYENLRTNVMSILGQVREPIIPPPPPMPPTTATIGGSGNIPVSGSGNGSLVVANSQDQFDSYLTKLQTICSENGEPKPTYCGPGSAGIVPTTPKTALQSYNSAAKL